MNIVGASALRSAPEEVVNEDHDGNPVPVDVVWVEGVEEDVDWN